MVRIKKNKLLKNLLPKNQLKELQNLQVHKYGQAIKMINCIIQLLIQINKQHLFLDHLTQPLLQLLVKKLLNPLNPNLKLLNQPNPSHKLMDLKLANNRSHRFSLFLLNQYQLSLMKELKVVRVLRESQLILIQLHTIHMRIMRVQDFM